jgi:folate-dependent phosphoribosylglycinamide formyltransferase PurN
MGKWVACISQTGTELYEICKNREVHPDIILVTHQERMNPKLWDLNSLIIFGESKRPSKKLLEETFENAKLITLHGFLYILPADICKNFEGKIYNGHPGAIERYPELKGKDPQIRAWNAQQHYKYFGTVIHEVVAEVDAGEIIDRDEIEVAMVRDLDDLYQQLKNLSINLWTRFLDNWDDEHYIVGATGFPLSWED